MVNQSTSLCTLAIEKFGGGVIGITFYTFYRHFFIFDVGLLSREHYDSHAMPQKEDITEPSEDQTDWSRLTIPLSEPDTDELVTQKDDQVEWENLLRPMEQDPSEPEIEKADPVDWTLLCREQL